MKFSFTRILIIHQVKAEQMILGARAKVLTPSIYIFICCFFLMAMNACSGAGTIISTPTVTTPSVTPPVPNGTALSTIAALNTPTLACVDGLTFISDVTIADNTIEAPGIKIDKQWLVQNSGTCNWDGRYRLRLVSGDALGASPEIALFPARAGSQVTIQIIFTSPLDAGTYISEWQAFDGNGYAFGDSFYLKIIVQP